MIECSDTHPQWKQTPDSSLTTSLFAKAPAGQLIMASRPAKTAMKSAERGMAHPLPPESASPSLRAVPSPFPSLPAMEIPHDADTTYLSHGYFRYIGKYPAQLVSHVLNCYPPEGPVLDPMCGGGTTLTEAYLRGIDAVGYDVNPVARLTSEVVTHPFEPLEFRRAADEFVMDLRAALQGQSSLTGARSGRASEPVSMKFCEDYFSIETRRDLATFNALVAKAPAKLQPVFRLVLLNQLRRLSRANIKKMNLEVDDEKRRPPVLIDVFPRALREVADQNAEFWKFRTNAQVRVLEGDATELTVAEDSFGAAFLHPPYMTNTAFSEFTQLQLAFLGIDHKSIWRRELRCRGSFLHEPNGVKKYLVGWSRSVQNAARAIRPGGTVTAVVGDGQIDYVRIPVGTITAEFAQDAGLDLIERFYHIFNNNTGQTQSRRMVGHHVMVFRKRG